MFFKSTYSEVLFQRAAGNLHTNFASHEFLSLLSGFSIKTKEERKKEGSNDTNWFTKVNEKI